MRLQSQCTLCTMVGLLLVRAVIAQEPIQWPGANLLTVRVTAATTSIGADTFRITYVVYNAPHSQQKAELFFVRTNANPLGWIATPGMRLGWSGSGGPMSDSLGVTWFAAGHRGDIMPGDSAAPFAYTAVGELAISRFHVQGWVQPPELTDTTTRPIAARPRFWNDSYRGWTIAVVPLGNMAAPNVAQRLAVATNQACGDPNLINEATLCENLNSRPRLAARAVLENNLPGACDHLRALITEVAALADTVITPEGRALLTTRAQQFIGRHCTP